MVISNTSPLYYLHQVGLLEVLRHLFGRVHTTPQVVEELEAGRALGLNVPDIASLKWIVTGDISVPAFLELIGDLGRGEASVLALGMERSGSRLIIDDHLAREAAKAQKMPVTGTLGVLLLGKEAGRIARVGPVVAELQRYGFRCSAPVVSQVLLLAGERPERTTT
jgi:predicted nucleic acid-binding protein